MAEQECTVADNVAGLLSGLDEHRGRVGQAEARDDLADAREAHAERRADTRRKIILGGAVMAQARTDPKFAKLMMSILRERVTDPRDRTLLALDMDQVPDAVTLPSAAEFTALAAKLLPKTLRREH
jgi:hypothetical protein